MKRLLLSLVFLTGCATVQLDLPPDAYRVQGANPRRWNQPLSFGEWAMTSVNEGTTRSFLADTGILQIGKSDQAYRMNIKNIAVECHTREVVIGRADVFVDPTFGREPILVCGFDRGRTQSVLALARTGRGEPSFKGELRELGGPSLEVQSLHRAPNSRIASGEPFGYEILRDGTRIAVVETVNQGRVWIDPTVANRDTLAAAAAALLLFRDPDAGNVD
ncbi:MAG TPA: hypothetical protein VHW00_13575 [Thermoanaerobaculia bacterium]|nr:hypothetical protein [Thermoanaerobaculia bacterium]